ncbi:MAG: hypothetical protein H3C35_05345 [Bacteroidetes bacterium]|nr:hypothetical protein [Bacteroidota bacterium]
MKTFFVFTVLLFSVAITNAQTKMFIYKNSGGTDSIALSDIKGISFKNNMSNSDTVGNVVINDSFDSNINNWVVWGTPELPSKVV